MSDAIEISATEHGRVRVFALGYQLSMEIDHSGTLDRLAHALGVENLLDRDVQIVGLNEIGDIGLVAFLTDAYGVDAPEIAPHTKALNALTGKIAILRSGAFGGQAVTLKTGAQARLVATLTEPNPAIPPLTPLTAKSADGSVAPQGRKPKPSNAAISGRIAMYVLIFLGLFVWLLIRIAR